MDSKSGRNKMGKTRWNWKCECNGRVLQYVTKALDICAPLKTITVHSKHKFGLSEKTKTLISERDKKENKCTNIPQMDLTEKPIVGFSHSLLEEVK